MKLDWEGRLVDNKSILVLKAALPYLDIPVGNVIDFEGMLRAIRCHCQEKEQRFVDTLLNLFMMKRMFSMMSLLNVTNASSEGGMEGMLEMLKSQMPKEQQEMFDMMSMMMTAMAEMPPTSGDDDVS